MDKQLKEKIDTALSDPSISDELKATLTEARDKLQSKLSKSERYEIIIKIFSALTNAASILFDKL